VKVFMAGGVPEVMLHLREMGLLDGDVLTATGDTLDATLDWWATSDRRRAARARLAAAAAVAPDDVIMGPDAARRAGLASTVVFPVGNLAPEGAVIKATALDPSVVGDEQVYRHLWAARVSVDELDALRAVKGATERPDSRSTRPRAPRCTSNGRPTPGSRPTPPCRPTRACGRPCSARAAARGPAACTTSIASWRRSRPVSTSPRRWSDLAATGARTGSRRGPGRSFDRGAGRQAGAAVRRRVLHRGSGAGP